MLLDAHLDQIELCSSTIAELTFPQPKIFTNALLRTHDITALIRDTEPHERSLFQLIQPQPDVPKSRDHEVDPSRRSTVFNVADPASSNASFRPLRKNTAVAAVLGGDLAERLRRERAGKTTRRTSSGHKDDVDVELLLAGAERLCNAYPMAGVPDRISMLRRRHGKVRESLEYYESLLAEQAAQLGKLNRSSSYTPEADEEDDDDEGGNVSEGVIYTDSDIKQEERDIKDLEAKKKMLEERVNGMEKDIGGILRG